MSSIPQRVNISHTLQSSMIETMKKDIKQFSSTKKLLTQSQLDNVDKYIDSLDSTFTQFCKDNEHVEKGLDGITEADIQLFSGLKKMYMDYMNQLSEIKKKNSTLDQEVKEDSPLEYIIEELPYQQASDRKKYIEKLGKSDGIRLEKSEKLFNGIKRLCILDGSMRDYIRTYVTFLKGIGYSDDEIVSKVKLVNIDKADNQIYAAQLHATEATNNENFDIDKQFYDDEPKKKISFSKYLKKDNDNNNHKRVYFPDEEEIIPLKRQKLNEKLSSILKNETKKKKPNVSIKFLDDSKLITVFGDGLPIKGLTTSPLLLKKILNPYNDGEPKEVVLPTWNNQKAMELLIDMSNIEESDISELKNGPIKCETKVPIQYRINFTSFNKNLVKPAKEPIDIDDMSNEQKIKKKNKSPIIVKAFGKNSLLLKKDRGGIPYKRVPEIIRNTYPPTYKDF